MINNGTDEYQINPYIVYKHAFIQQEKSEKFLSIAISMNAVLNVALKLF